MNALAHGAFAKQVTTLSPFGSEMLDLLPVGVLIVDEHLVVRLWNTTLADWSGVPSRDAVNRPLTDLFPTVGETRYLNRLQQALETGLPATFSASFHRHFLPMPARHGLNRPQMIQQTDVRRLPESPAHAMITIQDVSYQYEQLERLKQERLQLERTRDALTQSNQQLKIRNQELDEFSYVAGHDLQEPLRKISTFTHMLEDELPSELLSDDCKRYASYIQQATSRMKALIRDLLSLSQAGTSHVQTGSVDLNVLVREVLSDLEIRIDESNAVIRCYELPTVRGDGRMLGQLFQNLIGNALKFIVSDQPKIEISAKRDDGKWILEVADNGIGIEPELAEKIFKPFQRLHSVEEYAGTGIGLAISKKVVTRHGGEIWVEPSASGGSLFRFSIPDVGERA